MNRPQKIAAAPLLAIIGVNILWGFDFIAIEYMMDYMPPYIFTLIRLVIGSAVLLPAVFIVKGGFYIKPADRLKVFIAGGIGMALYFTVENLGTGLTSASFSSLIMATVPVFGMIGDRLVYGNRITAPKVICILASIIGVYMLVSGEPMGINTAGLIAMLAAAILWSFYIVYTKTLFEDYDLLTLMTGLFVSGMIVEAVIAVIGQAATHAAIAVTPSGLLITAFTAVVFIILGEFGYVYAIGRLSPTVTSAFENVLPVTAVAASFFIFGKTLTALQFAGALLIMVSVTAIALIEGKSSHTD